MALFPVLRKLQHKRVVLASASPRRREILSNAGLRFEVVPSRFKETLSKSSFPTPCAYAMETAKQKALEVAARVHQRDSRVPDMVIGADTIVVIEGLILEKPRDEQDAYGMLARLSGKEHSVFTGVCVVHCHSREGELHTDARGFFEETRVQFSELSEETLWDYVHSGEPMDKAGGYGVQALGGALVEAVHGDFFNVVGFPLNRFCRELARLYRPPGPPEPSGPAQQDSMPRGDPAPGPPCAAASVRVSPGEGDPSPRGPEGAPRRDPRDAQPSCPADLLRIIHSFKASQTLLAACRLKVFDAMQDGAEHSAAELAGKLDACVCGTRRLLDACAVLGLLRRTRRGYRSSALASASLASDGQFSVHDCVLQAAAHAWSLLTHPEPGAREPPSHVHSGSETQAGGPVQEEQVVRAAHTVAHLTARAVATAVDLTRFTSACHLGGGTSALAHALAREYPALQVTVCDLPDVTAWAHDLQPHGPKTARVSFEPGDVLRDPLPATQLYVLTPPPRAWPAAALHQLLRRVAAACGPGSGVLLADSFPEEDDMAEDLEEDKEEEEEEAAAPHGLARVLEPLVWPGAGRCSLGRCRRWLEQLGFRDLQVAPVGGVWTAPLTVLLGTWAGL